MKFSIYSIAALLAGMPFAGIGIIGIYSIGPHPLLFGFSLLGLFSILTGLYFAFFRIEFRDGEFIVYPGKKVYSIDDVVAWRAGEDNDCAAGCRRHLEITFERWYRRYMLLENDVSPEVFDSVLRALNHKSESQK